MSYGHASRRFRNIVLGSDFQKMMHWKTSLFKSNVLSARFGLQVVQQTQISPLDVDAVESFADGKILDDCLEARFFISLDHAICGQLWNILWTIHDKIAV